MPIMLPYKRVGKEGKLGNSTMVAICKSMRGKACRVTMSENETKIYQDCKDCAFYRYALPLTIICGCSFYVAQVKGWLKPSDWKLGGFRYFGKLPKTFLGLALGYVLGEVVYMKSYDCKNRFLNEAPDGEIAKNLRQQKDVYFVKVQTSWEMLN